MILCFFQAADFDVVIVIIAVVVDDAVAAVGFAVCLAGAILRSNIWQFF